MFLQYYKAKFKLKDCVFSEVHASEAMVSHSFHVYKNRKQYFFLKIFPRRIDYKRELYFLSLLEYQIPVPKILNKTSGDEDHLPALLMEALEGKSLTFGLGDEGLASQIGKSLALLHEVKSRFYGDLTEESSLASEPKKPFREKFEEGLEEARGHLGEKLSSFCQNYLESHIDKLDRSDGPCVIHRDFRPSNLIVHKGNLSGFVDWSSARGGFAEEDFCPLEHGEWGLSSACKASFLKAYGSVRSLPSYESLMPLLRFHRALAVVGFTVKKGTWNTTGSQVYKKNLSYLEKVFKKESF